MKLLRWPLVGVLTAVLLAGSVAYAAVGNTDQGDEPKTEDTPTTSVADASTTSTIDDEVEFDVKSEDQDEDEYEDTTSTTTATTLAATTSTTMGDDHEDDEDDDEDHTSSTSTTNTTVAVADGTYAFTLPDALGTITVTVAGGVVTEVTVPDGWDVEFEHATVHEIEVELESADTEVDVEIRDLTDVRVEYDHGDHDDSTTSTTVGESHDD
jgi:hypothetical protein